MEPKRLHDGKAILLLRHGATYNGANIMADFCKQCSIAIFGEDFGDLKGLGQDDDPPDSVYSVICEGCGVTVVNKAGECVVSDCMVDHATGEERPLKD